MISYNGSYLLTENQYQNFTHLYCKDGVLYTVKNRNTWIKMNRNGEILDSDSLPKVIISDLMIDNRGHVWLATENGIYVVQLKYSKVIKTQKIIISN